MQILDKLNDFNISNLENIKLASANFGEEPFLAEAFLDDEMTKKRASYIKKEIEPLIRKSREYKRWLFFVKSVMSIDFQCYHTGDPESICSIEVHHHPYTLFDLSDIVLKNMKHYTTFDIAKTVMQLHFMNLVGFIPLCKSSHERYHNKALDIPIELCEGNWRHLENVLPIPDRIASEIEFKKKITLDNVKEKWVVTAPLIQN